MLDYLHIPDSTNGSIDYFPGFSDTDGGSWVTWEKPTGAHMLRVCCIAGGGGGGSAFSSNTTASRGGGGGGGSSAVTIVTIPAYVLPDILYISSGIGGNGGAADGNANLGSNGIRSYVCIAPDTEIIYRVCYADSGKAGATAATATTGGSGGSGGSAFLSVGMILSSHGIKSSIAGQSGSSGANSGSGASYTYPSTGLLLSGGAGGAGATGSIGGSIGVGIQTIYNMFPDQGDTSGIGKNGQPGREIYQPLMSAGGNGGSAHNSTGAGGNGGAGGFGSGGGGGGAGGDGLAGGGGKGGNGLIIIHTW